MYIPDYIDQFNEHEARQQRELDRLPKCDYCDEPITGDYLYDINSVVICEACLNDNFRKPVEDYVE